MPTVGSVYESPRGTRIEILESTPERFSFQRTYPSGSGPPPFIRRIGSELLGRVATLIGIRAVRVRR